MRNLEEVYAKIETEWNRVVKAWEEEHGVPFPCGPGCSDCCRAAVDGVPYVHPPVGVLEAGLLRDALNSLTELRLGQVVARQMWGHHRSCLLLFGGKCLVYKARPLWCRVFGLFGSPVCGRVPSMEADLQWLDAVAQAFGELHEGQLTSVSEVVRGFWSAERALIKRVEG